MLERQIVDRWYGGSATILKLRQFPSRHIACGFLEETLTAIDPFYLVSMREEVRSHMGDKCVTNLRFTE